MSELGKITPAFHEGEEIRQWRVPVVAMMLPKAIELKVVTVYTDEGFLVFDVEAPEGYELTKIT